MEPCLFIHADMICLISMDDCLFFAQDSRKIDKMITNLKEEFILEPEDDVTAFLGIEFWKLANGALELVQPHLINQVIETVFGTNEFNFKDTPASTQPLHMDSEGANGIE